MDLPTNFTDLAQFQPKQKEAWYKLVDPACKYLLYGGAAAGGKSYFIRWAAIGLSMYYAAKYKIRGIPIGLFSEDYPTLKDRQIGRIKREVPPYIGHLVESRDEGYIFQLADKYGAGKILLRNLDDPAKYMSTEFAAEFVEELTRNKRDTFDDLRFRMRFPGIDEPKFVGASNPGGIGHGWVKSAFINQDIDDVEQDRFFFIPARYTDNTYIDETYIKQLAALPPDKRRAYMEGDWDLFAGQYFTEFRRDLHVVNPFVPLKDKYVIVGGMDWGRTAPFSFHLTAVEKVFHEGSPFFRATTFLEAYGTEKTPEEWAIEIKKKIRGAGLSMNDIAWIRGDPAMFTKGQDNSIAIADQFKENNVILRPASNDRLGGWELMHKWLSTAPDGKPYWQMTSNCTNLIRTLPELIHDENKVEDVDSSGEDHAADDQRYQFKHLKWLDGKVGGIRQGSAIERKKFYAPKFDQGQQLSVDPDVFRR